MKSCLIRPHYAGLFSLVNCVITCLEMYDHVSVDWRGSMYGPKEENLWDKLFLPTPEPPEEVEVIEQYPHQRYTYRHAAELYLSGDGWREGYRKQWGRIAPRPEIVATASEFHWQYFDVMPFLGVLIRAHTHAGEQITERSQSLEEYAQAIQKELRPGEPIFVMCQDLSSIGWLQAYFPERVVWYHPTVRQVSRDTDRHLSVPQTTHDAVNCLVEALILSWARVIVHPVSNIATFALGSGNAKSIYLP